MAQRGAGAWGAGPPISAQPRVLQNVSLDGLESTEAKDLDRLQLSINLKYTRIQVFKDPHRTKASPNRAKEVDCRALRTVIREFTYKYPDGERRQVQLEPENAMKPKHIFFTITVLWRKKDIGGLLQFLATEKTSKLPITATVRSDSLF
jgi:hypothetical protein